MPKSFKHDPQWAKAKQICRLNMSDIQMAKELGLSPKTLIKNQPSPSQQWKLPVKLWIRERHAKRFGSRASNVGPIPVQRSSHASAGDAHDEALF